MVWKNSLASDFITSATRGFPVLGAAGDDGFARGDADDGERARLGEVTSYSERANDDAH